MKGYFVPPPGPPLIKSLKPFACPVCNGRGFVHASFYSQMTDGTSANPTVACRSCRGYGVIWG